MQAMAPDVEQRSNGSGLTARSGDPLVEDADQNERQDYRADDHHADASIRRGSFDLVDVQELDWTALRVEPQTELLLKRGEDRGQVACRSGAGGPQILGPPLQFDVE